MPDASFFSGNGRFCGAVVGYKINGTVSGCLYYDCTFGNSSATTGIDEISLGQPNEAYPAYTLTTATTGMTLLYDGDGDEPNPDVVESYPSGLSYNGIFYAAEGSAVNFTPVVENNTVLDVTVSNGSLTNNHDGTYTLTMPASDVTLHAILCIFLADNADNRQTIGDNSGMEISVQLTGRTLYQDGEWNTLCLPFTIDNFSGTPFDGATVKTLETSSFDTKTGTLTLNFSDDLEAIEAGKPYIVKWEGDGSSTITSPVFTDVVIPDSYSSDEAIAEALANTSIETDHVVFIGTVSPVTLEANDRSSLYLSGGSTLYYPSEDVVINSCRAYFTLNGITAGDLDGEVNAFVLNFGDETTSIEHLPLTIGHETIEHSPLTIDHEAWYDLSGLKLNGKPTAKGIYIKDGKKIVIK